LSKEEHIGNQGIYLGEMAHSSVKGLHSCLFAGAVVLLLEVGACFCLVSSGWMILPDYICWRLRHPGAWLC
jgi:hypothetical protein